MGEYPWFRVYSEILSDRKLTRICRITGCKRVEVRGTWLTLLAMANDSPERGRLLWAVSVPVTVEDIADDLEMDLEIVQQLIDTFQNLGMLHLEGNTLTCTNWQTRQYESDNSTPRVRAHRARKKAQEERPSNSEETLQCNVTETLQKRDCNGPETDTETEADTETERETEAPAPGERFVYDRYNPPPSVKVWGDLTDATVPNWNIAADIHHAVGTEPRALDKWKATINAWLAAGYKPRNITGMLDWFRDGIPKRPRNNGNGRQPEPVQEVPLATGWIDDE